MSDDHLAMRLQPRFDRAGFPVPENYIAFAIPAADPFSVRRETDLGGVPRHGMTCESFLAVLSKVIRAVDQNLVVQRLGSEELVCKKLTLE